MVGETGFEPVLSTYRNPAELHCFPTQVPAATALLGLAPTAVECSRVQPSPTGYWQYSGKVSEPCSRPLQLDRRLRRASGHSDATRQVSGQAGGPAAPAWH